VGIYVRQDQFAIVTADNVRDDRQSKAEPPFGRASGIESREWQKDTAAFSLRNTWTVVYNVHED
jgi:hypothetical protein